MFKNNSLLWSYLLHIELPLLLVQTPQGNRPPSPHKAHPSVYQGSYKANSTYHNHKLPKTFMHNIQFYLCQNHRNFNTKFLETQDPGFKYRVLLVVRLSSCNMLLQHSLAQQILLQAVSQCVESTPIPLSEPLHQYRIAHAVNHIMFLNSLHIHCKEP